MSGRSSEERIRNTEDSGSDMSSSSDSSSEDLQARQIEGNLGNERVRSSSRSSSRSER